CPAESTWISMAPAGTSPVVILPPPPTNPNLLRRFGRSKDLHRAVLAPIATPGVHFSHWSLVRPKAQPDLRPDSRRIACWSLETNSQTRLRANVSIQLRLAAVLTHSQIHSSILIV